jgi:vancomycin resistance protein YoaR
VTIVAAMLGLAAATAAFDDSGDEAPARVRVAGVDVSGLSEPQVRAAVRHRAQELLATPLVITSPDKPGFGVSVPRDSLEPRPRVDAAVEAALAPRGTVERTLGRLGMLEWREVPLEFQLSRQKVDALVSRATEQLNRDGRDATVERRGGRFVAVPGASEGFGVDPRVLRARILEMPQEPISLPLGPYPPIVSDEDAEQAAVRAERIAASPVTVTQGPYGVELSAALIRKAIRFTPVDGGLAIRMSPEVLGPELRPAFASRERPARNARFGVSGTKVRITPSRQGVRLNLDAIGAAIAQRPEGATSVRARYERVDPGFTTAEAEGLGVTDVVAEFTTQYNCCEPRVTNIRRAATILNGTIIPAGGTFSMNEELGQRTEARGFVAAPQIEGGRLEDEVGGGVSQVATTLFNAGFFAGFRIEQHQPHQFYISRYPAGREATVSWGGPELIFVNDWDAPAVLQVQASDTSITVRVLSRPLGRRVESEIGEPRDPTEPEVKEVFDSELAPGARVQTQSSGASGFTVDYTRKVYRGDDLIKDETYSWTYSPQHAFISVGPSAAPSPAPEAEPAPEPDPGAGEEAGGGEAPQPAPEGATTG